MSWFSAAQLRARSLRRAGRLLSCGGGGSTDRSSASTASALRSMANWSLSSTASEAFTWVAADLRASEASTAGS
jgi:hypothetical protein